MKHLFFYIILAFLVFSCKKNEDSCEGKYIDSFTTISPYFNSYQFQEDSYWVYQNDASAQIDSQRVVSAGLTQIGSGGGSSCGSTYAENYIMRVRSFLTNDFFTYHIVTSSFYKKPDGSISNSYGGRCILSSNIQEAPILIPPMTINGNTFSNVKKVFVKYLSNPSDYSVNLSNHDMYFYFVDSIGLVKWEVVDGSTVLESWSIKSWEVVL